MTWARVALRAGAIAIAILGAVDPAITTHRVGRPDVALLSTDPRTDSSVIAAVRQRLDGAFHVVTAPLPTVGATVVVGRQLPPAHWSIEGPVVALLPAHPAGQLTIESFTVPATVHLEAGALLPALVRVRGAAGKKLTVQLRDGSRLVHEAVDSVPTADARIPLSIPFAPTQAGSTSLRLAVTLGEGGSARADAVVQIRTEPWRVLSYDTRPSWQATFLRRALERDPRLELASRVATSRNVSVSSGTAPTDLADLAALAAFDVIIIGAPEELTPREVQGLEAYLRRRAGRVVFLSESSDAAPYRALLGGGRWQQDSSGRVVAVSSADSTANVLRGAHLLWPAQLPAGAEVLATAMVQGAERPVVWRAWVGSGEVVVGGVLDAWQFRDSEQSAFEQFWRGVVGALAASAPPPMQAVLSRTIVAPTDTAWLDVTLRDVTLNAGDDPRPVSATAYVEDVSGARHRVRLWPAWARGSWRGAIPPLAPGAHRAVVSSGQERVVLPLEVSAEAMAAGRATDDLLQAWVQGKGGAVLREDRIAQLPDALRRIIEVAARPQRWHPMRSPWWILPFALLLSAEWWLRRREGER